MQSNLNIEDLKKHIARIYTKLNRTGRASWMHTRIYINGSFIADETTRQFMPELRMADIISPKSIINGVLEKVKNINGAIHTRLPTCRRNDRKDTSGCAGECGNYRS